MEYENPCSAKSNVGAGEAKYANLNATIREDKKGQAEGQPFGVIGTVVHMLSMVIAIWRAADRPGEPA